MNFADRVKGLRKEKKITQEELATLAGISVMSIRRYESGDREPKVSDMKKIATALDCTVTYLMFGSESDDPHMTSNDIPVTYVTPEDLRARAVHRAYINKPESPEELKKAMSDDFDVLNGKGQKEAVKRVHELTMIDEYTE